jgi:4-amino-4-deoxy-L-arabinose transferase-like glycosyltransferase
LADRPQFIHHFAFAEMLGTPLAGFPSMVSRRWLDSTLLVCAVAATRFAFRSLYLYDIDSVNFALGMDRFDPRVYQPHPPGYFLYICLGRLLNIPLHDANLALVVLSILASCGTVLVVYRLASEWFGPCSAQFAGALFLFSPLAWFHGTVALTYSVEAFFSAVVGLLCWRIYCGRENFVFAAAILLGISSGIRPSSLLFLGPLFLFSLFHAPKRRLAGIIVLTATLIAWFLPMIAVSGGYRPYFGALFSLWGMVPAKATVFNSSPATSIARAFTIVLIYLLGFGAASLAPLGALYRSDSADDRKTIFTWVWMAPALGFYTFIFLKFVNSGYLLLLAAPTCTWLGYWASQWYQNAAWHRPWKIVLIALCMSANILIFLDAPFYCSYRSVRRFEVQLRAACATLPQVAPAAGTLIIGFDSHFLGYRHAGYYLPDYVTVEYPEERLREGVRVFAMHRRETQLITAFPTGAYSRFVLFPLPGGSASYRDYVEKVRRKVPASGLQTVHLAGFDLITGPISELAFLFPITAKSDSGVSAPSLTGAACKQPCTPTLETKPITP